jgi:hypothetical protein
MPLPRIPAGPEMILVRAMDSMVVGCPRVGGLLVEVPILG